MQIVQYANEKEFTSVIVVHTNRREPGHILEHIAFFDSSKNSYGLCSCIHSPFQFLCWSELPAWSFFSFSFFRCSSCHWFTWWTYCSFQALKAHATEGYQGSIVLLLNRSFSPTFTEKMQGKKRNVVRELTTYAVV